MNDETDLEEDALTIDDDEDGSSEGELLADYSLAEESPEEDVAASLDELKPAIESLLFVAEEPLALKQLSKLLGVSGDEVSRAIVELQGEYDARGAGLEIREIANGWRISTKPQFHDFIRKYLKTRPSARLSLPALETLAVIAYKQPITIPEILEIRGVTSSSSIKTLLEKRLIVTKGRKETVGRPMLYGTSKEFLIHFGLRDLTELPSMEDFEICLRVRQGHALSVPPAVAGGSRAGLDRSSADPPATAGGTDKATQAFEPVYLSSAARISSEITTARPSS